MGGLCLPNPEESGGARRASQAPTRDVSGGEVLSTYNGDGDEVAARLARARIAANLAASPPFNYYAPLCDRVLRRTEAKETTLMAYGAMSPARSRCAPKPRMWERERLPREGVRALNSE